MATIAILFIIYATGKELDSGSSVRKDVEVQVLLTAPLDIKGLRAFFLFLC